ncbi:MAG: hypothetical protein JXA00_01950 [Candidatus Thermoplasmatota archaeon]|nr:hypothetical protein [Candidatus Thermoplasmatota archaeon]
MKDFTAFFHKTNPFWSHAEGCLFLAKRNDQVLGRIAAIIDQSYCKVVGRQVGFFGFFECVDEFSVAQALLRTAQDWLVTKHMDVLLGPIDGRVDVGCGFLCTGFDSPPSLLSTYSPPYYCTFAERFGMKKSRDLLLYSVDLTQPIPQKLEKKAQECKASGIHLRRFNRLRTGKELRWWIDLFLETFTEHWGYVPVSAEEVRTRFGVKQMRWIVDPRLFLIAEYHGEPVAYLWSTPDYNQLFQQMNGKLGAWEKLQFLFVQQRITRGKLHLIGMKKEFRDRHIGSLLNYTVLVEMKRRGYVSADVGWIDEKNSRAHATIASTGAVASKTHRVYEMDLHPTTSQDDQV